jgi:ribonuclease G
LKQVLINNSIFFSQVAILEGGMLQDFMYNEKSNENLLGNIYKGRVVNILPGMEAAFIDIGLNKNAYIFKDDLLSDKFLKEKNVKKKDVTSLSRILKSGEEILVQINREPIGEKNISVTTDISIPGKFIALIPNSIEVNISSKIKDEEERKRLLDIGKKIMSNGNGMIIRTFAANCTEEDLLNEYNLLSSIYSRIVKEYGYSYAPKLLYKSNSLIEKVFLDHIDGSVDEIYVEDSATRTELEELIKSLGTGKLESIKVVQSRNVFEFFNIEKQIDMLFERKIELDSGGSIFIDVTEAMTVIDVNSGKFVGKDNMEDTALSLNISALNEIARQIKLRNLSGIIIIDFIDMKSQENIDYLVNSAIKEFRKDMQR